MKDILTTYMISADTNDISTIVMRLHGASHLSRYRMGFCPGGLLSGGILNGELCPGAHGRSRHLSLPLGLDFTPVSDVVEGFVSTLMLD